MTAWSHEGNPPWYEEFETNRQGLEAILKMFRNREFIEDLHRPEEKPVEIYPLTIQRMEATAGAAMTLQSMAWYINQRHGGARVWDDPIRCRELTEKAWDYAEGRFDEDLS